MVSIGAKALKSFGCGAWTTRDAMQNNGKLSLGQHNCAIIPRFRRAILVVQQRFAARDLVDCHRGGPHAEFTGNFKGNLLAA
jgi:hypothetical protein